MGHVLDAESHVRCAVSGCESYYGISYGRGPSSRSISLSFDLPLSMHDGLPEYYRTNTGLGGSGQNPLKTPPISTVISAVSLVCVSVSGAPGGRLCFAFFFCY